MIKQDEAISIFSQAFNWIAALLNALLMFVVGLSISEWGIICGILFGAVSTFATVWSKRKLVKIAEQNGQIKI